jgi:hypothetical protein
LGDDWDNELVKAQKNSRITVVIVSANTDRAYYQREEIAAAIALARTSEHRVVPIYFSSRTKPLSDIPYGLRLKHGATIKSRSDLKQVAFNILDLLVSVEDANTNTMQVDAPTARSIRVIFENHPEYPRLNFSIANRADDHAQINSIKVSAVSIRDGHDSGVAYFTEPRQVLKYSLQNAPEGKPSRVFGDNEVVTLDPGNIAAFSLNLECELTLNVLETSLTFLLASEDSETYYYPEELFIVHSPISRPFVIFGYISLISRDDAISVIANANSAMIDSDMLIHRDMFNEFVECPNIPFVLAKASSLIISDNPVERWVVIRDRLSGSQLFSIVLESLLSGKLAKKLSEEIAEYALSWLKDPENIIRQRDYVNKSVNVCALAAEVMSMSKGGISKDVRYMNNIDALISATYDDHNYDLRGYLVGIVNLVISVAGIGATEYLINMMKARRDLVRGLSRSLRTIFEQSIRENYILISEINWHLRPSDRNNIIRELNSIEMAVYTSMSGEDRAKSMEECNVKSFNIWQEWLNINNNIMALRRLDWRCTSPHLCEALLLREQTK